MSPAKTSSQAMSFLADSIHPLSGPLDDVSSAFSHARHLMSAVEQIVKPSPWRTVRTWPGLWMSCLCLAARKQHNGRLRTTGKAPLYARFWRSCMHYRSGGLRCTRSLSGLYSLVFARGEDDASTLRSWAHRHSGSHCGTRSVGYVIGVNAACPREPSQLCDHLVL